MARVALADLDTPERFPDYAAACLKIRPKKERKKPFLLNLSQQRIQAAIESCLRNDRPPRVIVLKSRQVGTSTFAEACLFHLCHLRPDRKALVLAHTKESSEMLFDMSRNFYDDLPDSARPAATYFTKSTIKFAHNGSSMGVAVADERGGRGMTAHYVHLSEFAYMRSPEATLDAVMNAVPDQLDSLVIIESTAFGMNAFHDLWAGAVSGTNDFVPVFIPWFDEPGYRRPASFTENDLDDEEKGLLSKHRLSMEQLAWRRWAIRNKSKGDVTRFHQENPSTPQEAFLSTGDPVFSNEGVQWHQEHIPPGTKDHPIEIGDLPPTRDVGWDSDKEQATFTEPFVGAPLRIYEEPKHRHLYIAGIDTSEGDPGSDPSPIVVMDRMTMGIVAVWHGRRRPDRLAHTARALAVHYNKAHVIWESNKDGMSFGLEFQKLYDDFYWREASVGSVARKKTDKPGFNTNVSTKPVLWNLLRRFVDDREFLIRSVEFVSELGNVYYEMVGGQRIVRNFKSKTKDVLMATGLCLIAHMDDPDAAIAPLSEEEYDELVSLRREQYVARSMGLEGEGPLRIAMDRIGATARDLEEMDEREQSERARERAIGLEESV